MKKAVIFSPFWRTPNHVGNYRVDRFIRWLASDGYYIVLVRAGSSDDKREEPWGIEITVRDPLGIYKDTKHGAGHVDMRKPNRFRRMAAYLLFNPDPGVLWARSASKHPDVISGSTGATFVVSSSPPESAHVGAYILAKKIDSKLVIDMRDGWLDEPLKPLLRISRLQRWREGRLEKKILKHANLILVTSSAWKEMLVNRLKIVQNKTVVLTNGYPPPGLFNIQKRISVQEKINLVHAGRFTGSRSSQKVSLLLQPLLRVIKVSESTGQITLLGTLEKEDLVDVDQYIEDFRRNDWEIKIKKSVPRSEMMSILSQADGLLLLSATAAVIPSKLFEYLVFDKPVFAATPEGSAVWGIGESLNQIFLTDPDEPSNLQVELFIEACINEDTNYVVPNQFAEKNLSGIFIKEVTLI